MTNNINDLNSYLQYQALIPNTNFTDETSATSAGGIFNNSYSTNLANGRGDIDGQSVWNLGTIDYASGTPPALIYNVTSLLNTGYAIGIVNDGPTASFGPFYDAFPMSNILGSFSLASLQQFYQQYYTPANASQWGNFNDIFWNSGDSNLLAFKTFFQKFSTLLTGNYEDGTSNYPIPSAPTSFAGLLTYMAQMPVYTGGGDPTQIFNPTLQIPPVPNLLVGNTSPMIQFTGAQPVTATTTAQDVQNSLLQRFLATYPVPASGLITPQDFASNWETFINKPFAGPPPSSSTVQIEISVTTPTNSTPTIIPYKTAPLPYYSGAQITSFTGSSSFPTNFYNQLLSEYNAALQTATDWQGVDVDTDPTLDPTTQFQKSFDFFVRQVISGQVQVNQGLNVGQDFFNAWSEFIGPTTFLQGTSNTNDLSTYQQIYNVYYPNDPDLFIPRLNQFIQQALNSPAGIFNPSLFLDQWFKTLNMGLYSLVPTTLDQGDYSNTQILNTIFNNLVDTINELQNMTVAQANRLDFLTNYQKAYTTLLNEVPTFTPNDGSPIGGTDIADATDQQNADAASSRYIQNLRGFRSTISSQASNQQTIVNQTNSAVNAETNFATQILQLMTQIINSVFNVNQNTPA